MHFDTDSYCNDLIPNAVVNFKNPHPKHRLWHRDCLVGAPTEAGMSEGDMKAKASIAISDMFAMPVTFSAKGGAPFGEGFGNLKIQNGIGKSETFTSNQKAYDYCYAGLMVGSNNKDYYKEDFDEVSFVNKYLDWVDNYYRNPSIKHVVICSIPPREIDFNSCGLENKVKFNKLLKHRIDSGNYIKSHSSAKLHFYNADLVVPMTASAEDRIEWYCEVEVGDWRHPIIRAQPPVHYNASVMAEIVRGMISIIKAITRNERKRKRY